MNTTTASSPSSEEMTPYHRVRGFAASSIMVALLLTLFLEAMDGLILSATMPRITSSLHGFDRYTWVITAYLLASTAIVPLAGKLSDQFGRKGFLLGGTAIFLLGSALSGSAQTMDQLILFRVLQGLGSGIGIGLVFAVVGDIFPPEERASKQGLFGIVFGISNLCGPTIGGWIADHGPLLSGLISDSTRWRWLFYLNIPFGLLALITLWAFLPQRQPTSGITDSLTALRRIDWSGALVIIAATCSLLIGLNQASVPTTGWASSLVIVLLIASILLYALFFVVERRAVEPIIPLHLFRYQIFTVDALLTLLQGMILTGLFILVTLFFQGVLAFSSTSTGLLNTALSAALPVGAALATVIVTIRKRYQRTIIIGMALMTVGIFLLTRLSQQASIPVIVLSLVLVGLGTGSFFAVQMVAAQNALPQEHLGVGSGVIRYAGQLGPTLGAALVGLIVNGAFASAATAILPTSPAERLALAGTLTQGILTILVLSGIALVAAFFLKDMPTVQQPSTANQEQPVEEG